MHQRLLQGLPKATSRIRCSEAVHRHPNHVCRFLVWWRPFEARHDSHLPSARCQPCGTCSLPSSVPFSGLLPLLKFVSIALNAADPPPLVPPPQTPHYTPRFHSNPGLSALRQKKCCACAISAWPLRTMVGAFVLAFPFPFVPMKACWSAAPVAAANPPSFEP